MMFNMRLLTFFILLSFSTSVNSDPMKKGMELFNGKAMCASCHVYVLSHHNLTEKSNEEMAMLDESWDTKENSRLSCQLNLSAYLDGILVELAPEQ